MRKPLGPLLLALALALALTLLTGEARARLFPVPGALLCKRLCACQCRLPGCAPRATRRARRDCQRSCRVALSVFRGRQSNLGAFRCEGLLDQNHTCLAAEQ